MACLPDHAEHRDCGWERQVKHCPDDDGYGADIFCGGPLVFDERIEADVQAAVADLKKRYSTEISMALFERDAEPDIMAVTRDIARS